jgi:superfamily II DNA/RNA helicase
MGREQRMTVQEAFRHDPQVQVLLATDAAGEGIILQRAHLMVNFDLPWNPNRIEQRLLKRLRLPADPVAGEQAGDVGRVGHGASGKQLANIRQCVWQISAKFSSLQRRSAMDRASRTLGSSALMIGASLLALAACSFGGKDAQQAAIATASAGQR